jgi:hypothetical protein
MVQLYIGPVDRPTQYWDGPTAVSKARESRVHVAVAFWASGAVPARAASLSLIMRRRPLQNMNNVFMDTMRVACLTRPGTMRAPSLGFSLV